MVAGEDAPLRPAGRYRAMREPRPDELTMAAGWAIWFDPDARPHADGSPSRAAQIAGVVVESGTLDPMYLLIVAPPTLPATTLVEVVSKTRGAIAVTHAGHLRPLHLQFEIRNRIDASPPLFWLEARVSMTGLVIEAVPDVARSLTTLDPKQLAATLATARTTRGAPDETPVDVLVDPSVTSQRLVDVLVALDAAGVRQLDLGITPSADELARRGHRE